MKKKCVFPIVHVSKIYYLVGDKMMAVSQFRELTMKTIGIVGIIHLPNVKKKDVVQRVQVSNKMISAVRKKRSIK